MFFKKIQKPEKPVFSSATSKAPVAPKTPSAPPITEVLLTHMDQMVGFGGGEASGEFQDGKLVLAALQGGVSKQRVPAREGEQFAASAVVELAAPAANGGVNSFLFGPVYYDGIGQVLKHWEPQAALRPDEAQRELLVMSTAPPGAASVAIGMLGSWAVNGVLGDYVLAFRSPKVRKLG